MIDDVQTARVLVVAVNTYRRLEEIHRSVANRADIGSMSGAAAARASLGAGRMWAWRAHAYGPGGGELRLEAARMPVLRAPDHLLIRVRATSINPLDVAMLDGYGSRVLNTLRRLEGDEGVEFPLVCGRDFVGDVYRAGPAARLRPAHRVWGVLPPHHPGAHAQYVLVKDAWAGEAPESLDDAQAGGALYAALSACAVLRAAGLRDWAGGGGAGLYWPGRPHQLASAAPPTPPSPPVIQCRWRNPPTQTTPKGDRGPPSAAGAALSPAWGHCSGPQLTHDASSCIPSGPLTRPRSAISRAGFGGPPPPAYVPGVGHAVGPAHVDASHGNPVRHSPDPRVRHQPQVAACSPAWACSRPSATSDRVIMYFQLRTLTSDAGRHPAGSAACPLAWGTEVGHATRDASSCIPVGQLTDRGPPSAAGAACTPRGHAAGPAHVTAHQ
ncbi:hypothetical protein evm_003921 [Chilo suppressalis]|nr:hypothetical protein evm_003921 [Chilo suppressalis]